MIPISHNPPDISQDLIPPYPELSLPELSHLLHYSNPSGKYHILYKAESPGNSDPVLVVIRTSSIGFEKAASEYFPLSEDGWSNAWRALAAIDLQEFEKLRESVARNKKQYEPRTEARRLREELDQNTLALLDNSLFLGGYTPCASLTKQSVYDLRFMNDGLTIFNAGALQALGSLSYDSFTNIQITGQGQTQSTHSIVDPAGKVIGTVIRLAQPGISDNVFNAADSLISLGLRAAGTRSSIETVLVVQTTDSELFFLSTKVEPGQLRIDLSPTFGRIREVLKSISDNEQTRQDAAHVIDRLANASSLLDRELITRVEFEWLRSRLLSESYIAGGHSGGDHA